MSARGIQRGEIMFHIQSLLSVFLYTKPPEFMNERSNANLKINNAAVMHASSGGIWIPRNTNMGHCGFVRSFGRNIQFTTLKRKSAILLRTLSLIMMTLHKNKLLRMQLIKAGCVTMTLVVSWHPGIRWTVSNRVVSSHARKPCQPYRWQFCHGTYLPLMKMY